MELLTEEDYFPPGRGWKILVLDWDGTIFDSMSVKIRNFGDVLARCINERTGARVQADAISNLYQALSGRPRKVIFEMVLKHLGVEDSPELWTSFTESLSRANIEGLKRCSVFPDALQGLEKIVSAERPIFISSSVPRAELSVLVKSHLPERLVTGIKEVLGSDGDFKKGRPHFTHILSKNEWAQTQDILFIGDDEADGILAAEAGVPFIRINRSQVPLSRGMIRSIEEIIEDTYET